MVTSREPSDTSGASEARSVPSVIMLTASVMDSAASP